MVLSFLWQLKVVKVIINNKILPLNLSRLYKRGRGIMESANENVIFCTQCGRKNESTSKFCNSCGSALRKNESQGNNLEGEINTSNYNNYTNSDYSEEEMNIFLSKNQMFYLEKFDQINRTGDKKTWNWSAFLANIYWMLYRKMYVEAGLYFLANFILSFIPIIGWILSLVLWGGVGLFANSLYLDHINKKFKEINCADSNLRQTLINKYGGTNMVAPIVLLLIPIVIMIIFLVISVVVFGSMSYYY